MVTVIKKGSSLRELKQSVKKHVAGKKKDLRRFCGVISLKEDPVALQKQWRDEWK